MLPYLHKYITATPSVTSSRRSSKRRHKHKSSNKNSKRKTSSNSNNDNNDIAKIEHKQSESQQQSSLKDKPSITISSDTFHSMSNKFDTISSNNSSNSHHHSINSIYSRFDEHKYDGLPSTSESKVIFIETTNDKQTEKASKSGKKSPKSSKPNKKQSKSRSVKYWTVSIASKHNDCINDDNTTNKIVMGFGICDVSQSSALKEKDNEEEGEEEEEEKERDELDTTQLLNTSNYGYGYCVTYSDNVKYQSYHTKLKSLDDILIAFNIKTNKLTLWQNGKRFNRIFQLQTDKVYGFGIKLYGDDYSIKIMSNTGY